MKEKRLGSVLFSAAATTLFALTWTTCFGVQPDEPLEHWYYNIDEEGVALQGFDLVSYHDEVGPKKGDSHFEVNHEGVIYRFLNEQNLKKFKAEPEKYLPAYGGWCAFLMGMDKETHGQPPRRFPPDPTNFEIFDGKLYLFVRRPTVNGKQLWSAESEQRIKNADSFWASRVAIGKKHGSKPKGLHPAARMETLDFDFLVGQWESRYKIRVSPSIEGYTPEVKGTWKAWYGWDGFAIYDDWKQVGVVGGNSGPAIRSYDPFNEEWVMHFIPINAPMETVWQIRGKFDENGELHGEMSSVDAQGQKYLQRIHFVEITADRFEWRSDRSYDEGKTWIENWGVGENIRVN